MGTVGGAGNRDLEYSGIFRLKYQTLTPHETKAGYCHVLKFV